MSKLDPSFAKAMGLHDYYRTLLRRSLTVISKGDTLPNWIEECELVMADPEADPGDKLEANAMIVGVRDVMLEVINDEGATP